MRPWRRRRNHASRFWKRSFRSLCLHSLDTTGISHFISTLSSVRSNKFAVPARLFRGSNLIASWCQHQSTSMPLIRVMGVACLLASRPGHGHRWQLTEHLRLVSAVYDLFSFLAYDSCCEASGRRIPQLQSYLWSRITWHLRWLYVYIYYCIYCSLLWM
jgi:hypothetical protein